MPRNCALSYLVRYAPHFWFLLVVSRALWKSIITRVIIVVAFSSPARILGECTAIHSPPALFLKVEISNDIVRLHPPFSYVNAVRLSKSSDGKHHHLSFYREGRWGTTSDFATSFLHLSLFSTAFWDLGNSRPVHSMMLSFHLFLCLPCHLSLFTVPFKMVLARHDEDMTIRLQFASL